MTDITVSLSKAQKLLDRLRKAERENFLDGCTITTNYVTVTYASQGSEAMEDELQAEISLRKATLINHEKLLQDLGTVRTALFKGNVISGISSTLHQIESLRKIREEYKSILNYSSSQNPTIISKENLEDYYDEECQRRRDFAVERNFTVNRQVYMTDELKAKINGYNVQIDKLEDQRDTINHTHKITFTISSYTVDLLGL